jgi:hypothetical protein
MSLPSFAPNAFGYRWTRPISDELKACLRHLVDTSDYAALMTETLIDALCDHDIRVEEKSMI